MPAATSASTCRTCSTRITSTRSRPASPPGRLAQAYEFAPNHFRQLGLERPLVDEVFWGADFLHRMLAPEGYFYMTVFDRWAQPGAERVLTAYTGIDGAYSEHYQAAFREGAGVSIAALARAARLGHTSGLAGAFTALLAAVELYGSTSEENYLQAARLRARQLRARLAPAGYWWQGELARAVVAAPVVVPARDCGGRR